MRVVAIDPGKTTGYAWCDFTQNTALWKADEHEPQRVLNYVWHLLGEGVRASVVDAIVCESFVPRPGVYTWQPDALYTIGALKFMAGLVGVPFVLQTPTDAKRFATNDKLKKVGWWDPSPGGHKNDALRHLLLYGIREGAIEKEVLLYGLR